MYQLLVYYPDSEEPHAVIPLERGADAMALITRILAEHQGCEHVVVMLGSTRLFSVDCAGHRQP